MDCTSHIEYSNFDIRSSQLPEYPTTSYLAFERLFSVRNLDVCIFTACILSELPIRTLTISKLLHLNIRQRHFLYEFLMLTQLVSFLKTTGIHNRFPISLQWLLSSVSQQGWDPGRTDVVENSTTTWSNLSSPKSKSWYRTQMLLKQKAGKKKSNGKDAVRQLQF